MKGKFKLNLFWKVMLFYFIVYYGGLKYLFPLVSKWAVGAPEMLSMPAASLAMYRILIFTGLFVYITSAEERRKAFIRPLFRFFGGWNSGVQGMARLGVLVALPVLVGAYYFYDGIPRLTSPSGVRIQHPTMPGAFEKITNPLREPDEAAIKAFQAQQAEADAPIEDMEKAKAALVQKYTREGAALYAINCRPCHGMQANGEGPMARGFRLKPANFTDPGLLPTVIESYAFWRVAKGGPGLPSASTPWDSAMPIWALDIDDETRWKILLGEYYLSGVNPREPEKHVE